MTWEEAVTFARKDESLQQVIHDSYLSDDLVDNVNRFNNSDEFSETLQLLIRLFPLKNSQEISILDIGAGNGISSISFGLRGFKVTSVEPYKSQTLGFEAIQSLKTKFNLKNLEVRVEYGESLPFNDFAFDIVYARQVMHHAQDLNKFVAECARVLKKGGVFMTTRDHVINNENQKQIFLNEHPLHKFYCGENAFTLKEYMSAFSLANLKIIKSLGPLDSIINLSPLTKPEVIKSIKKGIKQKFRFNIPQSTALNNFIFAFYKWKSSNMDKIPGRLYTFIAKK